MNLIDLQYNMLQHCNRYMADISIMKTSEKIQHFALVVGRLSSDYHTNSPIKDPSTNHGLALMYPVLALSSMLGLNIGKQYDRPVSDLYFCSLNWAKSQHQRNGGLNHDELLIEYIVVMGEYCKVAEAIDHVEPIDFRTETQKILARLFKLSVQICAFEGILGDDLHRAFGQWVQAIERRHPMYENLGFFPFEEDSQPYPVF
jgi:hypothetical protein